MINRERGPDINTKAQKLSEVIQPVDKKVKPFTAFLTKFTHDWSLTLARALAYNLLTAMFPIALALLSILGIALGRLDPHAQDTLITHLQAIFPHVISSGDVIKTILHQLAKVSGVLGVIAVVLAIFTGSRLFILIERCFNILYLLGAEVNAFFSEYVQSRTGDLAELVYIAANKGGGDQPAASPSTDAQPTGDIEKA
ncbi:MAG TPA: YhjD/YihY/BrkB family envelope integrity protein [Ktedonobacteraceae bacterium]|nr:YhjD/YihY/BrkB family envelope integrity protein [Ktedonobacteraceae bacterium]